MRPVWLLAAAQALCASGTAVIILLGGILGTELAPRPEWATLPVSMAVIGLALATIPAAMLMQRIGRKRSFILSAASAGVFALAVAWAVSHHDFAIFCAAILAMGANLAFVQQYRFAAVEYVGTDRASGAVSTVMLGMLAAAVIGPQLALAASRWLFATDYVGSFVAVSLLYLGAVVVLAFLPPPPARAVQSAEPARPVQMIMRQPEFVVAVLAGLSGYTVMSFVMTATPISMHVVDGLSVRDTASVIQGHLLAMYLPSLVSGWLTARLGIARMMSLGLVLMGSCVAIALLGSHHFVHYWWGLVLLGAGWNLLFVAGTTLLTRTYRPAERFKAQAVNEFAVFGSQAVASLLAGPAILWLGWAALNLASIPLLLATAIALFFLRRSGCESRQQVNEVSSSQGTHGRAERRSGARH